MRNCTLRPASRGRSGDSTHFELPDGFQPKCKIYRRRKISRCTWISPDTLFTLCEVVLRKLLQSVVPRQKFWPTVISLLPRETARSTVWHQVHCPWEFNRHQRTVVNYANHWALLSATVQLQRPAVAASNIRIGSLVRNKITQLLLDLDYDGSTGSGSASSSSSSSSSDSSSSSNGSDYEGRVLPQEGAPDRDSSEDEELVVAQSTNAELNHPASTVERSSSRWCSSCRKAPNPPTAASVVPQLMLVGGEAPVVRELIVLGQGQQLVS